MTKWPFSKTWGRSLSIDITRTYHYLNCELSSDLFMITLVLSLIWIQQLQECVMLSNLLLSVDGKVSVFQCMKIKENSPIIGEQVDAQYSLHKMLL